MPQIVLRNLDSYEIRDLTIRKKIWTQYLFRGYASIKDKHGCLSGLSTLQNYVLELLALKHDQAVSVSFHHFSVPPTTFAMVHQAQQDCLTWPLSCVCPTAVPVSACSLISLWSLLSVPLVLQSIFGMLKRVGWGMCQSCERIQYFQGRNRKGLSLTARPEESMKFSW